MDRWDLPQPDISNLQFWMYHKVKGDEAGWTLGILTYTSGFSKTWKASIKKQAVFSSFGGDEKNHTLVSSEDLVKTVWLEVLCCYQIHTV